MKNIERKELTILMGWYDETDPDKVRAYKENKASFERSNPGVEVLTILNEFHGVLNSRSAWLCSDISIYKWYLQHGETNYSERYLLVEWDCWCDIDIKSYFKYTWDCDLVVPSIQYPERDTWSWFDSISLLPANSRRYATGIVPFCGILVSDRAMSIICPEIVKIQYSRVISELRLGTVATMLGIDPVCNAACNRTLGWQGISPFDKEYRGLHHPRKKIKKNDLQNQLQEENEYFENNSQGPL